ncbi:hypothetical protein HWV62_40874 [Athelia sp. TMB]|nr:hypothetical protein HWV62_40874 [Athelia sp. TMB]
MTLSTPPAPIPEAVEPATPKRKLAVLEAEHELAKAQPEVKSVPQNLVQDLVWIVVWILMVTGEKIDFTLQIYITSSSSTSDDSSDTLGDAGQSPRKRGRMTQSTATRSNMVTIKVTPRAIAYVVAQGPQTNHSLLIVAAARSQRAAEQHRALEDAERNV